MAKNLTFSQKTSNILPGGERELLSILRFCFPCLHRPVAAHDHVRVVSGGCRRPDPARRGRAVDRVGPRRREDRGLPQPERPAARVAAPALDLPGQHLGPGPALDLRLMLTAPCPAPLAIKA